MFVSRKDWQQMQARVQKLETSVNSHANMLLGNSYRDYPGIYRIVNELLNHLNLRAKLKPAKQETCELEYTGTDVLSTCEDKCQRLV